MNKALIYATKTGHSRKIASAVGKELNLIAEDIKSEPKLDNVDLLFLVGGIYGSQSAPELLTYLEKLNNRMVKKVILLTSSASKVAKQNAVRTLLKDKGIDVEEEEFVCQGSFLFMGFRHPNKDDIQNAVTFAKRFS
jgi:flavodoxin